MFCPDSQCHSEKLCFPTISYVGSESTNTPSDSTQASHPAKSEAFIDLTEEVEEDDDDVLGKIDIPFPPSSFW